MKKFIPQTFNDFLAIILIVGIAVLWGLQGKGLMTFPAEVNGGLIVTWTLIIQYYYRKGPPGVEKHNPPPTPTTGTDTTPVVK